MNYSLTEIMMRRRSIRAFSSDDIDIEIIKHIIATATHAPSNNNRQGWMFIAVTDKAMIQHLSGLVESKLAESKSRNRTLNEFMEDYKGNFTAFKNAPVVIVCCYVKPAKFSFKLFDTDEENRHFTGELISVSLVMQNIMLLSESMDIGTLIMTTPLIAAHEIKKAVDIPAKYSIAAFLCMGKYYQRPESPRHKKVEDILIIHSKQEKRIEGSG